MTTDLQARLVSKKRISLLGLLLILGTCLTLLPSVEAIPGEKGPDTGKMSWELFQRTKAGQRSRAIGEEVQTLSALLTTEKLPTDEQLNQLSERGYTISASYGRLLIVKAPADYYIDKQKGIHNLSFIQNATLPPEPLTDGEDSYQPITSGTATIGAPQLWDNGYRGQGIDIAIIDASFNPDNDQLEKMDPSYYLIKPAKETPGAYYIENGEVADNNPDHGTACGIIAGDVVPGADLHLISFSKGSSLVGWLQSLDFALNNLEADVVSTSVEFPQPYSHADGTGLLNRYVDQLLGGGSAPLIISAGNWAGGSPTQKAFYDGTFSSSGDSSHDFSDTEDNWDRNTLKLKGQEGDELTIILEWNSWESDPMTQDLDLEISSCKYKAKVAEARASQYGTTGGVNPVEIAQFKLPSSGSYCLEVISRSESQYQTSSEGLSFHLNIISDGTIRDLEHHSICGSIRGVATNEHPKVISVGAISGTDGKIRPYSSRGPTESGDPGPDIYGPDGVTGTNYERFYGTSAAAPYVAGAFALVRGARPGLSTTEIIDLLKKRHIADRNGCGNPVCPLEITLHEK